jgi:polysaccharide export outer membrane protein
MGREGDNDEGPTHETLSFADFAARGSAHLGSDRAVLIVSETGGGQQVFPVNRNPTVIGRSNNADLVLSDPAISDFHARVFKHSFGYTIEDMGSAEGTVLREKRVNHARLISGDTLLLGTTTITFLDERVSTPKDKVTSIEPVRSTTKGLAPRPIAIRKTYSQSTRTTLSSHDAQQPEIQHRQLHDSTKRQRRPSSSEEAAPSLDDVLLKILKVWRYLRQRAWLIFSLAAVGLAVGAASFKYYAPVRAAFCTVTLHPTPMANPIEFDARQAQSESTQFFAGAETAFKSNQNVMAALKRIGMPNPSEPFAESIAKRMAFENLGNHAYLVKYTPSFFSARNDWHVRLLDAHIKCYVETEIEKTLKVFVAEVDFLRTQTDAAEKRLDEISQETVKFREANSDQILAQGTLAGGPAELESRRIEVSARIERLAGELEGVRSQLSRGSMLNQAKSQSVQADRDALGGVNRKLAELRAQGFADGHPDVERLLTEQKNLQRLVDEHVHSDVTLFEKRSNVAYDSLQSQADQLEAQLRAARAERGTIESSLRSLRTVSSQSPKVNARLEELVRMKEEVERQHGLLFDRLKKAEVQLQLERVSATSRYDIVVPVQLESPPGRKAFALRMAEGLGLGLLLAALMMAFGELRRLFVRVARHGGALAGLVVLVSLLPLGCAHDERFIWAADLPNKDSATEATVHPRDTILVEVDKQSTLSGEFLVRDDGHYTQPMVGSVRVAGLTTRQVAADVAVALKDVVITPVVSVWITKMSPIHVSVVGEVKTPGIFEMTRVRSLLTILAQAGWLTEFAHQDRVYVVRAGSNERIRFHVREITTAEPFVAQFQLADADVVVVE